MALQVEDIVDVMDALYSVTWDGTVSPHNVFVRSATHPNTMLRKFEYLMLTDHSCGHDRKRRDGLDTNDLRKGPTAAARHMRDVVITEDVGVLSKEFTHPLKLKVGMTQKLVFGKLDNFGNPEVGPFWWSPEDRLKFKHDEKDGIKSKDMVVAELREVLKANGVDFKGRKVDLLKRCEMHVPPLPTKKQVDKVVREGWYGKSKGSFQILWERGYINPLNFNEYKVQCPKDSDGTARSNFSLTDLIQKCYDFVNEPTMLQYIGGEKLGIVIDRTPKCSPELAGEGVEYSWACAKGWYRLQPNSKKKTKESFHNLVKECLGPKILSTVRVRMFSRRAREYIEAYYLLEVKGKEATPVNLDHLKRRESATLMSRTLALSGFQK